MNEIVQTASLMDEADIDSWWAAGADITGRLLAAIAVAATAVPAMNSRYDPNHGRFEPLPTVDLGITIETEHGVSIPVLKDVGHKSVVEIRRHLNALRVVIEDCPERPSITLVNFGHGPCRYATLPITPPEVAIVAAGRVLAAPVHEGGRIAHRHRLPLTLTYDTRASHLLGATRFMGAITADLAKRDLPLSRGLNAPARKPLAQ
jgi:2-oxoisovalerate dehydrogenase E2 component (dihydrolipoyl transacylase)